MLAVMQFLVGVLLGHYHLKSEGFIYTRHNSLSDVETMSRVTQYLKYYNAERIQEKLGYLSPIDFGGKIA